MGQFNLTFTIWDQGRRYDKEMAKVNAMLISMLHMLNLWDPQGFWGSGENGHLFSGSWGALVIILGEKGRKLIILGI